MWYWNNCILSVQSVDSALYLCICRFLSPSRQNVVYEGWGTGCHAQDTDFQHTCRVHQPQILNESLSGLPLTLPRMCCVCIPRHLWGHMLWSTFDQVPSSSCHTEKASHACTLYKHTELCWLLVTEQPCWKEAHVIWKQF